MNEESSRLRGTRLLLARIGALTVSLGILAVLMIRAGGGCRTEETAVVPEARSAAPATTAPLAATAPPASSGAPVASASALPRFFPGSKSMPDFVVDPSPPAPQPKPSGSSRYNVQFPGTKSDPHILRPSQDGR